MEATHGHAERGGGDDRRRVRGAHTLRHDCQARIVTTTLPGIISPRHELYDGDRWYSVPEEVFALFLRAHESCGSCNAPHSLAEALRKGLVPKHHLQAALEIVNSYPYPRQPKTALPARSLYNDPGWDNVVRAIEEDR